MPLIHDNPWLIEKLLKSVSDEEKRLDLFKKGQVDQALSGALKSLLQNLRDQITPTTPAPGELGQMSGSVDLTSHNMDSMGDFVEWLAANKTPIGGKIIVQAGIVARPGEDYDFYRIEPGTKILTETQAPDQVRPTRPDRAEVGYWVNSNGLKQYLQMLQADKTMKNNVMFQVQLLKLIQFANEQLDTNISETYQAPALDDNQEVDRLPKPIDLRQWNQPGSEQLLYKDIKSLEGLNAWFGQAGRGYLAGPKTITIRDQEWNICLVLNYLNTRANALYQRRTAESGPIAQAYMKAVADVAKQANCTLSGQQQQAGGDQQRQQGATITPRALIGLASLKPFNIDEINFQEISTFLDKYQQIKPGIEGLVLQVKNEIQQAQNMRTSQLPTFDLSNLTKDMVASQGNRPKDLLTHLYNAITIAKSVHSDFMTECESLFSDLKGGSGILAGIREQQSVAMHNLSTLARVRPQFPQ